MLKFEQLSNGLQITVTDKKAFKDYYMNKQGFFDIHSLLDVCGYLGNDWFDVTGLFGLTDSPLIGQGLKAYKPKLEFNFIYFLPNYAAFHWEKELKKQGTVFFTLAV